MNTAANHALPHFPFSTIITVYQGGQRKTHTPYFRFLGAWPDVHAQSAGYSVSFGLFGACLHSCAGRSAVVDHEAAAVT
jgi:hypothetical protein